MRKSGEVRRDDVFHILNAQQNPMKAYQIPNELKGREPDIAPPIVCRALAALTDQARAHRLESLKAFVACRCAHTHSVPVLAICEECGEVEEHDGAALLPKMAEPTASSGLRPDRHIVEIHGRCTSCTA